MTCPTIHGPPEAAQRALWRCADAAVETAAVVLLAWMVVVVLWFALAIWFTVGRDWRRYH